MASAVLAWFGDVGTGGHLGGDPSGGVPIVSAFPVICAAPLET